MQLWGFWWAELGVIVYCEFWIAVFGDLEGASLLEAQEYVSFLLPGGRGKSA